MAHTPDARIDRVRTVLDGIPGLVSYWDRDLCVVFANRAYSEWFDRDEAEMAGLHMSELLGEDLYALNGPPAEQALRGERQQFTREVNGPDGDLRFLQATYTPDERDGEVVG